MLKKIWEKIYAFFYYFITLFDLVMRLLSWADLLGGVPDFVFFLVMLPFLFVIFWLLYGPYLLYQWLCSLF